MVERTEFSDGAPCWVDATVPDLDAAKTFYGSLFGWAFADQGSDAGHYTMCLVNDVPVAGLMPGQADLEAEPAFWNTYLATRDVAAAARAADQHGGKLVMSPTEVMNAGRMAYVVDPTGAAVGLWQGRTHAGFGLWGEPGAVGWSELVTPDGMTADAFYQLIFGYDQQQQIGGGDYDYSVWKTGGERVCGRWQTTDLPAQWVTYFSVVDTTEAARRVGELGGQVDREPWDTPYGEMATVVDPWGMSFSLIGLIEDR
jgi:hypothetical protein